MHLLVIPIYNRPTYLDKTLTSLLKALDGHSGEVFVVNGIPAEERAFILTGDL